MKLKQYLKEKQYISYERFKSLNPALQEYLRDEHKKFNKYQQQKRVLQKQLKNPIYKKRYEEEQVQIAEKETCYQILGECGVPFLNDGTPIGVG